MEYWWKENKGYVVPVAAGAVVLLLWHAFVLSGIRADAQRIARQRATAEASLETQLRAGVPSEDVVKRAARDLDRAKKLVTELGQEMALRVADPADPKGKVVFSPAGYKPPGGKPAHEHFQSHQVEVYKKVFDAASRSAVGLPNEKLGFPAGMETDEAVGTEYLARLAIVERLALAAVQAGVSKIDAINAVVGPDADLAVCREGLFLNKLSVRMKVVGPSRAVFEWLHGVQGKGDFLAVEDFRTEKISPHEDIFTAEMEVSGLVIDPKGSLTEAKE